MTSTSLHRGGARTERQAGAGRWRRLMRLRPRPTVRLRLALIYGSLFLIAGAALLGVNYVLVQRSLNARQRVVSFRLQIDGQTEISQSSVAVASALVAPALPAAGPSGAHGPGPASASTITVGGKPVTQVLQENEQSLVAATLHTLIIQSLIALAFMAAISLGLGWAMAGRVLRPVRMMTAAARRLSERNLHERIGLQGPADELKELADTFDALLERLDRSFDSQRRFVANASHELRTPLTIMRTEIDVTLANPQATPEELRSMAEVVRDAGERSERLIESLLILARSDRGLRSREAVDLSTLATRLIAQVRLEAQRLGLRIEPALAPAGTLGDSALLEHLVGNLVENALRYNQAHGWIAVATGAGDDGHAWLRVANSGPAVPPEAVGSLFEPFRRLGPARSGPNRGVGLGLSIVRSVAEAHGGTVCARAPGSGGLEVEVRLPQPI
jgi:signal transduction histidine kinase